MTALIGFFIGIVAGIILGIVATLTLQVREEREARERAKFGE